MHLVTNRNSSNGRNAIISWALYDLANTIFFLNIVSIHFGVWVVNDMGASDSIYGYANIASMLLVIGTATMLGAVSDHSGRRIPFLMTTTFCCVFLTMLLGVGGLFTSLVIFVGANYMFQSGLIFYDALLPTVAPKQDRGKIGSFGVGVGYIGSLIGAGTGILLIDSIGHTGMFKVSALLFLVFSIPCFIFIKECGSKDLGFRYKVISGSITQLVKTLAKTREYPGLSRFLFGRVFYADVVNTLIIFIGIYVTNELGFTNAELQLVLLVAIISSILGAFIWAFVVDSLGPKRTLNLVLYLWVIVLGGLAAVPLLSLDSSILWVSASLAGIAMGGIWCADRPYLLRLVPPEHVGEFFGIYSIVGRFASVIGPLVWIMVADTLGLGRPIAVLTLVIFIMISYVILQGVDDKPRIWTLNSSNTQ
ncbi:MFS transporter [SAR202 cluster bacterium AD-804-J14_MRT_500m]|nr:MFS transporter [SAR202 cluster bacterium AD-804-J14_MRT_500m]